MNGQMRENLAWEGVRVVSINDVAGRAGVSRQTVSNVLNAPERVAPGTRTRVEDAIDALGYRPNQTARSLRAQRTRLIGLALTGGDPDWTSTVINRFLHAFTEAAAAERFNVLLFPRGSDPVRSHLALYETSTVDGFVLMDNEPDDPRVQALAERGVPFVAFGRTHVDAPHDVIDVDGASGTRAAVEHLVAKGRRNLGFVGWPSDSIVGEERLRGAREGCAAADLDPDDLAVVRRVNTIAAGTDAASVLLDQPRPPDGIVAASDTLAIGVFRALRARGLTPGRDVGVVGFDDAPTAAQLDPPLTSVRQPLQEVAERIVQRIEVRFTALDEPHVQELIAPRLIVRET